VTREKPDEEVPLEPLLNSETPSELDNTLKQTLLKSSQVNGEKNCDSNADSNILWRKKEISKYRATLLCAEDIKPNKRSSFTGHILVDEVAQMEKLKDDEDFLVITREFRSANPSSGTDDATSDIQFRKKSNSPPSVSYSKMMQANSDALYNTEMDKVLVKASTKHLSGMDLHQRLANALSLKVEYHILNRPEQTTAFIFSVENPHLHFGFWDIYNFPREMERQDISDRWHLSAINGPQYHICTTYPALLYFPSISTKDVLEASAEFRSRGRLPALVWISKKTRCWMMRSAQPLTGAQNRRSQEDESLLEHALSLAPPNSDMVIFDARSFIAAGGNRFKGKGTEVPTNYKRCRLVYLDIPNIHAVRDSGDKLLEACLSSENEKWLSLVESTSWLNYVSLILKGSNLITRYMTERKWCALVHCSDGWDRTSQLCSLSQLMMDPFYRTIEGFIILIEKEWISFGHKFRHRLGHPNYANERSPVFLQFLDCVYQILEQAPNEFEFTSKLLLRIAEHLHSEWFGTFITDSEMEKNEGGIMALTVSLWAHILAVKDEWINSNFKPNPEQEVIVVEHNIRRLRLWQDFFLRYDSTSIQQNMETEEVRDFEDGERLQSRAQDMVVWVADSKVTECKGCGQKFSYLMRRKHHCRACGYIFCNDCTKSRMPLPQFGYDEDVRVCDRCFEKGSEPTGENKESD
jgi:myotubularin-related protein 1/2